LESVEQALAQAGEQTAKREQELAAVLPADGDQASVAADWHGCFDQLDGRLQELRAGAEQAEHTAAGADTSLAEAELAFRQWLCAAEQASQRLADWNPR
jgi:hypothetical protein